MPSNANSTEPTPSSGSPGLSHGQANNRTGSKLLKRWHCRSRSTFRCLLLMSKELSKSVYLKRNDLSLIEAWIVDLKNIHYMEPPMLPRRRSHTNPCLGADGLHGVSFYPSLEPNNELQTEDFIVKRNETFRELMGRITSEDASAGQRDKRETERPTVVENPSSSHDQITGLLPPEENSTYSSMDWSTHPSEVTDLHTGDVHPSPYHEESSYGTRSEDARTLSPYETYYRRYKQDPQPEIATSQPTDARSRLDYYHHDILSDQTGSYRRRGFPVVDKSVYLSDPRAAFLSASRSAKHLHEALAKHHEASVDGYPILKAMTETMCPGFGPLIPYQPQTVHSDVLLIIAFTNHHYDLIPTLEVLYRSAFPNMLYCGNPHESVELFLRKYQSVEHRSFSFLPTYTRATYECVLGAMEMNYEVKGYVVITDETLIKTWNIEGLDKTKIWVSSSDHENRHVPVTKDSWPKLDPRGQKLPRLLDGLANTWKMLTYFLVGQDTYILEPATIKRKRSVDGVESAVPVPIEGMQNSPSGSDSGSSDTPVAEALKDENNSAEKLETLETSYVPVSGPVNRIGDLPVQSENRTDSAPIDPETKPDYSSTGEREPKSDQHWDLTVSSLSSVPMLELEEGIETSNETFSGNDETTDDVEVGDDDDDTTSSDMADLMKDESVDSSSPSPMLNDRMTDEIEGILLVNPTSEATLPITQNSTDSDVLGSSNVSASSSDPLPEVGASTPSTSESSVGVPLYHVEHVEPPTPPTYHKPDEKLGSGLEKDMYNISQTSNQTSSVVEPSILETPNNDNNNNRQQPELGGAMTVDEKPAPEVGKPVDSYLPVTEKTSEHELVFVSTTTTPTPIPSAVSYGGGSDEEILNDGESELKREMEILLDGLKKVYLNLVGVVQDYQDMNITENSTRNHDAGFGGKLAGTSKTTILLLV